jgi:hypothetical protein
MDEQSKRFELSPNAQTHSAQNQILKWKFSLYRRAIHPDLVIAVNQLELIAENIGMQISFLEDGHVVEYLWEDQRLTQVLMPEAALLPEHGLLSRSRVVGSRQIDQKIDPRLQIYSSIQSDPVDPEVYQVLEQELEKESQRAISVYRFPASNQIQLSFVQVESFSDSVLLQWVHTLPKVHTVIRTQTLLEWK